MTDARMDRFETPERRTSPATIILIILGIAVLGAVGYDFYTRGQAQTAIEQDATKAAQDKAVMEKQVQDALARVAQADATAQASEQEKVVWMSLARAAAGTVATRPPTLYSLQHAVFGSADQPTRVVLRDYFKKAENLDKVSPLVVFVASLVQSGTATKNFVKACEPLFMGPLPEMGPTNPDALWCYEFLKRRQAEGGDVAAWQRMLMAASAEISKKS
jgi:hypothetical protein